MSEMNDAFDDAHNVIATAQTVKEMQKAIEAARKAVFAAQSAVIYAAMLKVRHDRRGGGR